MPLHVVRRRQRRTNRTLTWSFVFLLLSIAADPLAHAAPWRFGGHVKYQYTYTRYDANDVNAVFGENPALDHSGDMRLIADGREGAWDFTAHYELLAIVGDTVKTQRTFPGVGIAPIFGNLLPNDDRRLWDLTHTLTDDERRVIAHRLDRLSVGYSNPSAVVRFGRQAVSWGNGLVFQVLDFVNPFSPVAIDKDYKTGDDMLYGQLNLGTGADVQAMIVPRRDPATRDIENTESSYATKLRGRLAEWDAELLLARHYGENTLGIGLGRSVGGAVWRLDASYTGLEGGGRAISLLTNIDYSWTWAEKNFYGYIEYFRNGVGESNSSNYISPNNDLATRLQRGELFTLGRDYVGVGLQVELTPLFNLFNNLIWNANDGSVFYQLRSVYDVRQNMQLIAGINYPHGNRGEEFGGIPTPLPGVFAAPGRSLFARLAWFF